MAMARILLLAALFTVAAALRPLGPLTRMPGGVSPLRASDPSVLDKPAWAAGGFVSDVVNALIGFKPLFNVMKIGARSTLISTAESNDIPWRQLSADMATKQPLLDVLYSEVLEEVAYPAYYQREFHAYDEGNLNWQAAFECESATMSMAIRTWPLEALPAKQAQQRLRDSFTDATKKYILQQGGEPSDIRRVLDVGCSVGVSTTYLAQAFPQAPSVVGLDLSPHFLAVARGRQQGKAGLDFMGTRDGDSSSSSSSSSSSASDGSVGSGGSGGSGLGRVQWKHANIEHAPYADCAFDLVCSSFMFHELPQTAARAVLREMVRLVAPGGWVAITDINPQSPVIQGLPPALFTLMKSTEPWSDQYYALDMGAALAEAGFEAVEAVPTDPRHHAVFGRKKA